MEKKKEKKKKMGKAEKRDGGRKAVGLPHE